MAAHPDGGDRLSYDQIMQFLHDSDWPVTSPQIAERFDITQQGAYYRLQNLHERGEIERKKIGQTVLWRPTEGES